MNQWIRQATKQVYGLLIRPVCRESISCNSVAGYPVTTRYQESKVNIGKSVAGRKVPAGDFLRGAGNYIISSNVLLQEVFQFIYIKLKHK